MFRVGSLHFHSCVRFWFQNSAANMSSSQPVKVLILGAGVSGLSTAYHLRLSLGDSVQITVLEARDRLGGRVHTVKVGDCSIDLGGSWMHGIKGNPLAEIAKTAKLDLGPVEHNDNDVTWGFDSSGRDISAQLQFIDAEFDKLQDEIENKSKKLGTDAQKQAYIHAGKDRSFYSLFDPLFQSRRDAIVKRAANSGAFVFGEGERDKKTDRGTETERGTDKGKETERERETYAKIERDVLVCFAAFRSGFEGYHNADMTQLSFANIYDEKEWGEGGGDRIIRSGYVCLVDYLAHNAKCEIKLKHIVTKINFNVGEEKERETETKDREKTQTQREVIVSTDQGDFSADFVVVTLPLGVLKTDTITYTPPLSKIAPAKHRAIQRLGFGLLDKDAAVIARCLSILSRAYGDEPRNAFIEAKITRWRQDPFARGSYSFLAVGSCAGDRDELARSIRNVHFAGEHTNRRWPATVHGAFQSGQREANKIAAKIKAMNKDKDKDKDKEQDSEKGKEKDKAKGSEKQSKKGKQKAASTS